MTILECTMMSCQSFSQLEKRCLAEQIEIGGSAECRNYVSRNKCDHILGTIPAWHRPGDENSDHLIFQSTIDDEYSDIDRGDIEEYFDFCPKCGQRN